MEAPQSDNAPVQDYTSSFKKRLIEAIDMASHNFLDTSSCDLSFMLHGWKWCLELGYSLLGIDLSM